MKKYKKTILLVEDEAIIAAAEAQMLRQWGYDVVTAFDGNSALETAVSSNIDMVLMDIDLGKGVMDGTEAASRILERKDLPIVFLSSHTEPEIVEKTEKITSYGYVVKFSGNTVIEASLKMAFKLHAANQEVKRRREEIEHSVEEIKLREKKLEHINRVLLSVRHINQIITKDPDKIELLDRACQLLVETRGYFNAWIVLLEDGRPVEPFFHRGFRKDCFAGMAKQLQKGKLPPCAVEALKSQEIVVTKEPEKQCVHCPIQNSYSSGQPGGSNNAGMTARIEHGGKIYGWLSVSVPYVFSEDEEEHGLFKEIIEDIGYALSKNDILIEKEQAFIELNKSERLMNNVFDSIQDGISILDTDLTIHRTNQVMREWYARSVPLEGKKCYFCYQNSDTPCDPCPSLRALESGKTEMNIVPGVPGSSAEWIELYSYPMKNPDTGSVDGVVEFVRDITKKLQVEMELKNLNERMTLATDSAEIGVWDLNLETDELVWDDWMYRLYGVEKDNFNGAYEAWKKCVHPDEVERADRDTADAIKGKREYNTEFRIVRGDGETRHIRAFGRISRNEQGRAVRMTGVNYDITERKLAEEHLHESEENLRATLNSIGDAVIATDTSGLITRMNPVAEKLTGWNIEEARGHSLTEVFNIIHAYTGMPSPNPVDKVLESGQVVGMANHTMLISKDGTRYQIADSGSPIRNSHGIITGVVLVFRDVSEEYRIREELKRNEDRLSKVLIAANDGTWDWDLKTNEVYFDPRYYEMAGYKTDEFPHKLEEFVKRIHPDDVDYVMDTADRHLKGEIDRFEVEFRFATQEGGWIWILGRGVIVERAEDGVPTRFVGTHTDISKRKEIEENLRTERRRLSAVLEGTNVGSWEWNVQTGELTLNERWAEIIGYTLEEISPTSLETWLTFCHLDDLKISNDLLDKHFRGETEYYECEVRMRHKDGHWVWILDRGKTAAWTEDGNPLIISGTHQDITERKLAAQKIQDALNEKDYLLMELQHRVKNSFGMIISMLNLKSGSVESKETKETLGTITSRVRALSELYSLLYKSESVQDVRLDEYCTKVIDSMQHLTEGIHIRTELQEIITPIREAATVGLIITELVTNAINHAYHQTGRGTVQIQLRKRNERIVLKVGNDGCTLPDNFTISSSSGMGLQLVQALAEQHQGSVSFECGKKTTVTVELVL